MADESTQLPPNSSGSEESGEGSDHILCASAESVSVNGVAPETGDTVSAKVEGAVTKVEGDRIYIKIAKVNGEDVPGSEESEHDDEADLIQRAEKLDAQSYA